MGLATVPPAASSVEDAYLPNLTTTPQEVTDPAGGHLATSGIRTLQVDNAANSVPIWLKFYDTDTTPDHSSDTPRHVLRVPAGASGDILCCPLAGGTEDDGLLDFATGIFLCAATAAGTSGSDPPAAVNAVVGVEYS